MILRKLLNFIAQFPGNIKHQFRNIYLNSNFYDKKISKINNEELIYKPSPHLLSSLIKYQTQKINVDSISEENLWENENINNDNFKRLNNFYWFFSLDLKSSRKKTQKIVSDWITKNHKYNSRSWEFDLTSKRIIAWLSNHSLTLDQADKDYSEIFNGMIQKQTNHLIGEINNSTNTNDKIIGCAAIILVGLSYKDEKKYLSYGLNLLKKISNTEFDNYGFTKSRSIKQLIFYLKYFILIREWFKEAQVEVPDSINETIFYLGQGYAFTWQNIKSDILMNGNNISNNDEFDHYLRRFGYKFKNNYSVEIGYFTSNGRYKDITFGPLAIGKIDIDSLSIDIKKSVKLDPSDAWSFIGSLGAIYQKSTVTTQDLERQICSSTPDLPCSGYRVASGSQTKFYDTRLELGIGTRYDLDEKISLRSMVKFIPNDLSFSSSTPYYISFGALYNF